MNIHKHPVIAVIVTAMLAGAGYGLYALGRHQGLSEAQAPASAASAAAQAAQNASKPALAPIPKSIAEGEEATRRHIAQGIKAGDIDPITGRKVLYYHDPMTPGNKFDKPAKSPFMEMMLVPVYAEADGNRNDTNGQQAAVAISARTQQNLGVRTAQVVEGMLAPQVSAVGSIAYNERDQVVVQARAAGYVARLHVRATLDRVSKGQPLADLHVPEWIAAQEEFLSVRQMRGPEMQALLDGARQRMRQVGMTQEQILLVERTGQTQARITLTSPIAGVVTELAGREGMAVQPGATLFRINGVSSVWAHAEVPESQAAQVRPGTKVQASSPAAPGAVFEGTVQALVPELDPGTRTIKARVELNNPGGKLVPGMFVSMRFVDARAGGKSLLIPSEALIQTGKRSVVMVAEDHGRFHPVEVEAGMESGGQTEIKRGLQAGQRVVVSAQFLIDSEASLKGVEARLNEGGQP